MRLAQKVLRGFGGVLLEVGGSSPPQFLGREDLSIPTSWSWEPEIRIEEVVMWGPRPWGGGP